MLGIKMEKLCSGQRKLKHLTFNCDNDLGHIQTKCLNDTSTYKGERVCEGILKSIDKCRSYTQDKGNLNI